MALHDHISRTGDGLRLLREDPYVASALISMYAKCGSLVKAQQVMDQLTHPDAFCWSALIAGYAQHGQTHTAVTCFKQMKSLCLSPTPSIFTCILKAIGRARALDQGTAIHDEIAEMGLLEKDVVLGASLVNMYVKCGALAKAQQVFDEIPIRDEITWTTLITGYAQQGHSDEALKCFERMQGEGFTPDAMALPCILKAIGTMRLIEKGEQIHNEIIRKGLLKTNDIVLATALVDMYAKCGSLGKAQQVFDDFPVRNLVLWTALITGYVQHGQIDNAFDCYQRLLKEGLEPDLVTFSCILNACASIRAIEKGKQIHNEIARKGLLGKDTELGTALVDMYAKCGALAKAQQVFDELPVHTVVSWTTLITGYVQEGQCDEVLRCFEQMRCEGFSPDSVTFGCILKACSNVGGYEKGKRIHKEIITRGLLHKSIDLGAALVDMYAKCGTLVKAQQVFDELPMHYLVTWNALIAGYAQQGQVEEALNCFHPMRNQGILPDAMTFAFILKACGNAGSIERGKQIHDEVLRLGLLGKDVMLGTALVYMYAKCGLLEKAQQVFDEIPDRNIASWTVLIAGYAQQGKADEAFKCCEKMEDEGLSPNDVTFLCVLNACSHSGLLDESQMILEKMSRKYGVMLNPEHHTCMIDVFGRAGHFDKAISLIQDMPSSDILPVWHSLLSACKGWRNVELGRFAFDRAVCLDNQDTAAYVLMANIYASAGMEEDAEKIEAMRVENSGLKNDGHRMLRWIC